MKKAKRMAAALLSAIMLLGIFALPASAAATEIMVARINNGATVSQNYAYKASGGNFSFNARSNGPDGWSTSGNEWVWFRGRNQSGTAQATSVAQHNYYGSTVGSSLSYINGYGATKQNYKIAIEYDNSNPYEYVNLVVQWTP